MPIKVEWESIRNQPDHFYMILGSLKVFLILRKNISKDEIKIRFYLKFLL